MPTKNVYDTITKTYSSGSTIPSNFVTDTNIQTPTASNLASVTTPKIPDLTSTNTNTSSVYSGINANGSSYVDTTSNTVNNQANGLNNTGASTDYYTKYLNDLSGVESVNAGKIKSDLETQYGLTEKQAEANRLKAIINANTAEAEAAKLAQGQRLSSMGQISGAQADIERKLAIRNSPYIAQYQAALGDYEAAQNTVNSLYTAQLTDAENEYNKKINLLNTAYQIATTKEKQDIEKEATKAQQDFELKKIDIETEKKKEIAKYEAGLTNSTTSSNDVINWATAIKNGTAKISDIPKGLENSVIGALNSTPDNELKQEAIKSKIDLLNTISNDSAIRSAVGPTWAARFIGSGLDKATGSKINFIANVEQLISSEFLSQLINVKAQGGTFGALQKAEQDALTQSATKLGNFRKYKGEGEDRYVSGYKSSEKDFLEEVDKIKNLALKAYFRAGASPEDLGLQVQQDGTVWSLNSDGKTFEQIK